ncbi:MAG: tyrosine-type recombinase/integrase [Nitrospira sp.]|nr:tyrosine-type recombinase/integrase [Nitrospira sp.]MBX3347198.1 tyrosine-type recombinase/integrase [Nitrospira sp.]
MELVPLTPERERPDHGTATALVPLATTGLRRAGGELPPVCLQLSSSTLIGLRVYLDEFARQLAAKNPISTTARTYFKRGRLFITWLQQGRDHPLRRLDRACLEAYRAWLDHRFANLRTKNGYLTAVRQFLKWLVPLHPGLVNPADFVQGWTCSRQHTRRHLPVEDAKLLLATLESDPRKTGEQRARNVAMAYLMLKTGLRTIEVSRARVEHLQELVPSEKWRLWVHGKGRSSADESVQVLKEVYERIQTYLALRPGPLEGSDPLFATTACHDRGGNVVTQAGLKLSTRAIHRIITEGLLLAGVKKPGIVVHSLRHSTPTFALLNDANPTRVQKMMRHQHYATTEIYVEEVQRLLDGAEDAVTQI